MSKRQLLILLGLWIVALLFLGFPSMWNKIFIVVSGFLIIIIAYKLGSEADRGRIEKRMPYVEHRGDQVPEQVQRKEMHDITNTNLPL